VGKVCGTHGRGEKIVQGFGGHAWERRENCTRFWWERSNERDHSEDQGVGGRMGSEWTLGRLSSGVWIGFDWLRTGTGGGLL
jgi:hypothetical protein